MWVEITGTVEAPDSSYTHANAAGDTCEEAKAALEAMLPTLDPKHVQASTV